MAVDADDAGAAAHLPREPVEKRAAARADRGAAASELDLLAGERRDERESRDRQQAAPEERPDGRVAPQERMRSQDCHALHRNLRSVLPRRSWFIHSTENGASSLAARATLARSTQGENDLKFAQGTASRDDVRARTHTLFQREIESWNCQDLPLIPRLAGGGPVGRPSWPRRCFSQRSRPAPRCRRAPSRTTRRRRPAKPRTWGPRTHPKRSRSRCGCKSRARRPPRSSSFASSTIRARRASTAG